MGRRHLPWFRWDFLRYLTFPLLGAALYHARSNRSSTLAGSTKRGGRGMHERAARPRWAVVALLTLALTTGLVMAAAPAAVSASGLKKVDRRVLQAVSGGKQAVYWAILRQKADLSGASSISDWTARGWYVYNQLNSVASSSQQELRALLKARGVSAKAFWIINAIRIKSGAATLQAVAARTEVARILPKWHYTIHRQRAARTSQPSSGTSRGSTPHRCGPPTTTGARASPWPTSTRGS